jgi:hypothetical protein
VQLEYLDEVTVSGLNGYRYVMSKYFVDNGTSDPGTVCKFEEDCLPRGVLNVTSCCHAAPGFISNPHFFNADPYYVSQVSGLQPESEKHQFYITLEPVSQNKETRQTMYVQRNTMARSIIYGCRGKAISTKYYEGVYILGLVIRHKNRIFSAHNYMACPAPPNIFVRPHQIFMSGPTRYFCPSPSDISMLSGSTRYFCPAPPHISMLSHKR